MENSKPTYQELEHAVKLLNEKLSKFENEDSFDYFESIINAIVHSVVILDENRTILKANKTTFDLTKLEPEQLIGTKCFDIFHPTLNCPPSCCPFKLMSESCKPEIAEMIVEAFDRYFLVSCTPVYKSKVSLYTNHH